MCQAGTGSGVEASAHCCIGADAHGSVCPFPGTYIARQSELEGLRQHTCIVSQFWRLKTSGASVLRATVLLKALVDSIHVLGFPYSGSRRIPCLQLHHSNPGFTLHMAVIPVSSLVPLSDLFCKSTDYCVQNHPNPIWPRPNVIISAKTLFLNKVTFIASTDQDLNLAFREDQSNHYTQSLSAHQQSTDFLSFYQREFQIFRCFQLQTSPNSEQPRTTAPFKH